MLTHVSQSRTGTPENIQSIIARGRGLWDSIYEPHADKLYEKLRSYHPDFIGKSHASQTLSASSVSSLDRDLSVIHSIVRLICKLAFIIQSYGSVLAPLPQGGQEQGNLSRALGSVVGTACLRAEGRVGPQLTSHVFGLLKARQEQYQNEEDKWLSSDEGTEWVIRTVDKVLDSVTSVEDLEVKVKL